jgi:hypothetical protein
MTDKPLRPATVTYDAFREMAADGSLDKYEKICSSAAAREGREHLIFQDILGKLPVLKERGKIVADIGAGCTDLPILIMELCRTNGHQLVLSDSREMLDNLPDQPFSKKVAGHFPDECREMITEYSGRVDAVIVYSVLHYVVPGYDLFGFFDGLLTLLAPGGMLLIADIPNVSKRRRFLASENGVRFHKANMKTTEPPNVQFNTLEPNTIDDGLVLGLVMRARGAGFDAYLLPQASELPMANRREDLLIVRP